MNTLGDRIKTLRKDLKLTQKELGEKLNVGKSTISQYENNVNTPDIDIIMKLSNIFDVSIDFLLGKTNLNKPSKIENEKALNKLVKLINKDSNISNLEDFSIILEQKLKDENLYDENSSYEEKVALAQKILDILKIIENK